MADLTIRIRQICYRLLSIDIKLDQELIDGCCGICFVLVLILDLVAAFAAAIRFLSFLLMDFRFIYFLQNKNYIGLLMVCATVFRTLRLRGLLSSIE
jgi:hypothetical protein